MLAIFKHITFAAKKKQIKWKNAYNYKRSPSSLPQNKTQTTETLEI